MKNKKKHLMATLSAMMMVSQGFTGDEIFESNEGKSKEEMKLEQMRRKGLKEFTFGEISIFARNEKNAIRKAKNKGLTNLYENNKTIT